MTRDVHVALAQACPELLAAEQNRERSVELAQQAFRRGANIVVLPELFISGYTLDADGLARVAEPLDGPTVAAWQAAAAETGGLVVGGFCERDGGLYNTAVAVGPQGPILHYRKTHLFSTEKSIFVPGDHGLPLVTTDFGVLAICVCYDLRFVEVLRSLSLRGAELVCVPTAWVRGFDAPDPDETVIGQVSGVLAQANLDQVFVACASMVGATDDHRFLGSSVIVDPFGKAVIGPMSRDLSGLESTHIDLELVARARSRSPFINPVEDRRRDIYGVVTEDGTL